MFSENMNLDFQKTDCVLTNLAFVFISGDGKIFFHLALLVTGGHVRSDLEAIGDFIAKLAHELAPVVPFDSGPNIRCVFGSFSIF